MPKVQETVLFNLSPKGQIEGWLLACAERTVQVNLPKDSDARAPEPKLGETVTVRAVLEAKEYAHPVYLLVPEAHTVHGRVARLNYARHGEVNGFILDDGTFIHQKPEGAKKHPVRVGDEVDVKGTKRVGPAATVIEARDVTRARPGKRTPRESRADA